MRGRILIFQQNLPLPRTNDMNQLICHMLHHSDAFFINPMNPEGWCTGLRTCVPQTLRAGFPAFAIGVPETLPASKQAHVNLFLAILFTSEGVKLHFRSQLKG